MAEQQYMEEQKRDLMSGKSAMVELGLAQNEQSEALKRCEQSIFRYAVHGAKLPTGIHLPCYAEQIAEILYPEEIEKKKRQLELDGIRRKEKLDKSKTGVQVETAESKGRTTGSSRCSRARWRPSRKPTSRSSRKTRTF